MKSTVQQSIYKISRLLSFTDFECFVYRGIPRPYMSNHVVAIASGKIILENAP
jgi:hypothetical protein